MARTYINYFFNPLFIPYKYLKKDDFDNNFFYFIINEIISIFMIFFGAVYNEYIILYFCDLEYYTKHEIFQRALERETTYSFEIEKDGYIINNIEDEKIEMEMV